MGDDVREIIGDQDGGARTLAFECDDDRDFKVRLSSDRDEARVDVGSKTYRLELADRENGQRVYRDSDSDVRLTVGNDKAYLRIPGGSDYQDCERS
jgi:hypothetical protein